MHVIKKLHEKMPLSLSKLKKRPSCDVQTKPKTKNNRFNGLTEEEIQQNFPPLPDYLRMNLNIVFVGINPSLTAAFRGRYYAGPGNHFYKLLNESGLVSRAVNFEKDHELLQFGIGLTNIVTRSTRSSADLSRAEIKEGSAIVEEKLRKFKPKIAVFNGRCIYDVFANKTGKSEFNFGLQPKRIGETALWVVPSSSARCSSFPRMIDKLQFYSSLKKYLSFINGEISEVDVKEFYFKGKHKEYVPSTSKMWRRKATSMFLNGGKIANQNTLRMDVSDENIVLSNNSEFVIKEIRSKDGIERPQPSEKLEEEIEEDSLVEKNQEDFEIKNSKSINEDTKEDNNSVSETLSMRKERMKEESRTSRTSHNSFSKQSVTRPKQRKDSSDFLTLIKERLEVKKRKREQNLETCDFKN